MNRHIPHAGLALALAVLPCLWTWLPEGTCQDPSGGASLSPIRRLPLCAVIGDLFLSPDAASLYALDLSEGRALKIDPASLAIKSEVRLSENPVSMDLSPKGDTLYVVCQNPLKQTAGAPGTGIVQVISTREMKLQSTFPIDPMPVDVEATDSGMLWLSCTHYRQDWLVLVDTSKKAVEETYEWKEYGAFLRLMPDGSRLYVGDFGLSRASFSCVLLGKRIRSGEYPKYETRDIDPDLLGGDFEISPDARFLVGSKGAVLRLSRMQSTDLAQVAKIAPFLCASISADGETLVTGSADGTLKRFGVGNFALESSSKVEGVCTHLVADSKRHMVYASLCPATSVRTVTGRTYGVGDLVAFTLKREGK